MLKGRPRASAFARHAEEGDFTTARAIETTLTFRLESKAGSEGDLR